MFNVNDSAKCCMGRRVEKDVNLSTQNPLYLNVENAHQMVRRFLNEKGMSKEELAGLLDVRVKSLDQLFSENIPAGLMSKINLPLVKLYCNTEW